MTLVKLNRKPYENSFTSLVDNLFSGLPGFFNDGFNNSVPTGITPVNVKETDKLFVMEVIAPGFDKSDFKVDIDSNLLTISADKKSETADDNQKTIRTEYTYKAFKRSFTLDEKIDATKIEASYINGVLTLNLPKKEEVKQTATQIVIK
ncbi:MAG: Hsp20/alpha crystallin family protein [Chitinophagaceae bacterium]|nr:Hsp20/alpha crystallin family protein [Chitinophagaceae bacterium]